MHNLYMTTFLLLPVCIYLVLKTRHMKRDARKLQRQFRELNHRFEERQHNLLLEKKALELQNKTKDKLLSFISHELRHPLMYLDNLSLQIDGLLHQRRYHQLRELNTNVAEATSNLGNLLSKLLDWNTLESEHLPQDPQILQLDTIVELVIRSNRANATVKGITIHKMSPFDQHVSVDKVGLIMVLQNLVGNAIKYTHRDGEIWLLAKRFGASVRVVVQDSGIGMTPGQLKKIDRSEPQPGNENTSPDAGSGIGLVISREIMRLNHGQMIVKSRRNVGTTFTLYFPAARRPSIRVSDRP